MHVVVRAFALSLLLQATIGFAQPAISEARIHATPPGARTAAAYLTIANGPTADRLLGAQTAAARRVEVHGHVAEGGLERMVKLDELPLAPGATAQLAPGGVHLMLIDLAAPLSPGANVVLELEFAVAGIITIDAPVIDARTGAAQPQHDAATGSHH